MRPENFDGPRAARQSAVRSLLHTLCDISNAASHLSRFQGSQQSPRRAGLRPACLGPHVLVRMSWSEMSSHLAVMALGAHSESVCRLSTFVRHHSGSGRSSYNPRPIPALATAARICSTPYHSSSRCSFPATWAVLKSRPCRVL